jgi:hypothetical protein
LEIKKYLINSIVSFGILVLWNMVYIVIEINCYKNNDMFLGWPLFLLIVLPLNFIFIFLIMVFNRFIYNVNALFVYVAMFLLGLVQTFKLLNIFVPNFNISWMLTYVVFLFIYALVLFIFKVRN